MQTGTTSHQASPSSAAPDSLTTLLPSWQRHLRAANLAPRTIQSYGEAADRFRAFLSAHGVPTTMGRHPA